jgi:hypothetical protein
MKRGRAGISLVLVMAAVALGSGCPLTEREPAFLKSLPEKPSPGQGPAMSAQDLETEIEKMLAAGNVGGALLLL